LVLIEDQGSLWYNVIWRSTKLSSYKGTCSVWLVVRLSFGTIF